MILDATNIKNKLEAEKKILEDELKTVGRINPENPQDWEGVESGTDNIDKADDGEVAEGIEEFETNTAILKNLEGKLHDINHVLEHIEQGTYGICEIGREQIEEDRLHANPTARTCKAHMND